MSETIAIAPTEAADEPLGFDPADILLNLVVSLLVPLFITAAGGELYFARMAALATIGRTQADLLTIVQIISFSLGAADSVCRSMADDLPLPMVLRLRGNANSTARTAERNRLVLTAAANAEPAAPPNPPHPEPPRPQPPHREPPRPQPPHWEPPHPEPPHREPPHREPPRADAPHPDVPLPNTPRPDPRPPASPPSAAPRPTSPAPASPAPASPAPASRAAVSQQPTAAPPFAAEPSESEIQQLWANAMSVVAAEYAAGFDHLPPDQRQAAQTHIRALNNCAVELRSGKPPTRPRPGDLGTATPNPT
ncbi:hypothetical protein [Rhodopila sp.]|uniref:hypothetical protein n=1 Tax=Rhodopila sp. TaxID=2480087 RepID=UPI003D0CE069